MIKVVRGDRVQVAFNPDTGIGGAAGVVIELRRRSALVLWDGGDWADWIGTHRLEVLS